MAQKENKYKGCGINTQSVHTGTDYDAETGAIRRPCTWRTVSNYLTTSQK